MRFLPAVPSFLALVASLAIAQIALVPGRLVEKITNTGIGIVYGIRGAPTLWTNNTSSDAIMIAHCTVSGSSGYGIGVSGAGVAESNRVGNCTGISVSNGVARGNYTHSNGLGVVVSSGLAVGNTSCFDTTAFSFGASVRAGPTVAGGGGFDATANIDL